MGGYTVPPCQIGMRQWSDVKHLQIRTRAPLTSLPSCLQSIESSPGPCAQTGRLTVRLQLIVGNTGRPPHQSFQRGVVRRQPRDLRPNGPLMDLGWEGPCYVQCESATDGWVQGI